LGNVDAAIDACQRGIDVDRMHDAAWRILIRAYEAAGDAASGRRAQRAYAEVLAELGIAADA
jgi:two-component SAPR family response regulator